MNRIYVSGSFEWGGPIGTMSYVVLCDGCARKRLKRAGKESGRRSLERARARAGTEWRNEREPCDDCGEAS